MRGTIHARRSGPAHRRSARTRLAPVDPRRRPMGRGRHDGGRRCCYGEEATPLPLVWDTVTGSVRQLALPATNAYGSAVGVSGTVAIGHDMSMGLIWDLETDEVRVLPPLAGYERIVMNAVSGTHDRRLGLPAARVIVGERAVRGRRMDAALTQPGDQASASGRLHALEERQRRLPAADRHRLVGRRPDDLAEAAPRPFGAQPLRVDHAGPRPHLVDAGPRVEDLHRRRRVDIDEEDRVAVVRLRDGRRSPSAASGRRRGAGPASGPAPRSARCRA